MPTYEHVCEKCSHEWEDNYKMADPVPESCPKCKKKGGVKRLISWSSGKVELSGRELVQKLRADGKKMIRDSRKNENMLANLVGEEKYNNNQKG